MVSSLEFSSHDSQWEDILSPDAIDKYARSKSAVSAPTTCLSFFSAAPPAACELIVAPFYGAQLEGERKNDNNIVMTEKTAKQRLKLGEIIFLALPFLAFLLAYGLITKKLNFNQWPPNVDMTIGFWFPVIFCSLIYFLLLFNLYERRKGTWKWHREGLVSVFTIILLWYIVSPVYKASISRVERHKVGIRY